MATTALTPKQQQVKSLLEQGKTPAEVAKKLKVNVNSVYQHIRRMKAAEGETAAKPKRTARKTGGKRTTARKSTARKTARKSTRRTSPRPAPAPAPAPVAEAKAMTPLQAIRHRKSEIESQIAESARRVLEAAKVHNSEKESHAKLEANRAEELKQLTQAEAALTKTASKSRSRSAAKSTNGTGSKDAAAKAAAQATAPAPAATPEPQSDATAAEAALERDEAARHDPETGQTEDAQAAEAALERDEVAVGAGVEQERPGVETVPEFAQPEGEDPFAG